MDLQRARPCTVVANLSFLDARPGYSSVFFTERKNVEGTHLCLGVHHIPYYEMGYDYLFLHHLLPCFVSNKPIFEETDRNIHKSFHTPIHIRLFTTYFYAMTTTATSSSVCTMPIIIIINKVNKVCSEKNQ